MRLYLDSTLADKLEQKKNKIERPDFITHSAHAITRDAHTKWGTSNTILGTEPYRSLQ
jgi:hypothetical protein